MIREARRHFAGPIDHGDPAGQRLWATDRWMNATRSPSGEDPSTQAEAAALACGGMHQHRPDRVFKLIDNTYRPNDRELRSVG